MMHLHNLVSTRTTRTVTVEPSLGPVPRTRRRSRWTPAGQNRYPHPPDQRGLAVQPVSKMRPRTSCPTSGTQLSFGSKWAADKSHPVTSGAASAAARAGCSAPAAAAAALFGRRTAIARGSRRAALVDGRIFSSSVSGRRDHFSVTLGQPLVVINRGMPYGLFFLWRARPQSADGARGGLLVAPNGLEAVETPPARSCFYIEEYPLRIDS
jgi:hypothetical protein